MATKITKSSQTTKRGATSKKTTRKKVASKTKSPTKVSPRPRSTKAASASVPRESPSANPGFNPRNPDQMPANVHPHSGITNDQRNRNQFAQSGTPRIQGQVRSRVRHQQGRRQS